MAGTRKQALAAWKTKRKNGYKIPRRVQRAGGRAVTQKQPPTTCPHCGMEIPAEWTWHQYLAHRSARKQIKQNPDLMAERGRQSFRAFSNRWRAEMNENGLTNMPILFPANSPEEKQKEEEDNGRN